MNSVELTPWLHGAVLGMALSLAVPSSGWGAAKVPAAALPGGETPAMSMIPEPVDLIQDRPTMLESVWDASSRTLSWMWNVVYDYGLDWVTPPGPTTMTKSVSVNKKEAMQLFHLLSDAGYKLKEIDSQVGLIPTIAFKFGQVRELSEADFDYLENTVEEWYQHNPGVYSSLQRTIVDTVIAVNLSSEYHVSALKVQLLPLPKVAFTVTPKVTALGEESSALMTAIQRVDRNIQKIRRTQE